LLTRRVYIAGRSYIRRIFAVNLRQGWAARTDVSRTSRTDRSRGLSPGGIRKSA
jgi:hypothetical protein